LNRSDQGNKFDGPIDFIQKMALKILTSLIAISSFITLSSQIVQFESSNLPIIIIDTDGEQILDDPKITGHMGIINHGSGERNYTSDVFNDYDGYIGIEYRGFSSQNWPKKPYAFETRDSLGENNNVSLLGLPSENDWVLHAPFVDKTLMRNVLIYSLAAEMGWYAPRTQYCELIINGEYLGVFVLVEKLKKDKNRVDITKPDSSNLSGGYLLEMTLRKRLESKDIYFNAKKANKPLIVKFPKSEDITNEQLAWIENYYNDFEDLLMSSTYSNLETNYKEYIDPSSYIDHMILSEAFNQLDAFSHSQYFYKKENGKLYMGPAWDYNRTMGNCSYFSIWETNNWWLLNPRGDTRALYTHYLMTDPKFLAAYAKRWNELREGIYSFESINTKIDNWVDLLEEARERNYVRWPVIEENYSHQTVFGSYEAEVENLKNWMYDKFTWLDEQFSIVGETTHMGCDIFRGYKIKPQKNNLSFKFNWTPASLEMDGVLGLANITSGAGSYSDLACLIRFYKNGEVEVRDGDSYRNDYAVNYVAGEKYNVRMEVDISNKKYDVYMSDNHSTEELKIASQYSFRTEQNDIDELNGFVLTSTISNHFVNDIQINNGYYNSIHNVNLSDEFNLHNFPNPFSTSTTISLNVPFHTNGSLCIYNIQGQLIKNIKTGKFSKGEYNIVWDGTNNLNGKVKSGIYLLKYSANNRFIIHKVICL